MRWKLSEYLFGEEGMQNWKICARVQRYAIQVVAVNIRRYTGQSKITENLRGPGSGVGWSVPCYGGVAFRMIGRSGLRRATTWKSHPAKTEAIPV